MMAVAAAASGMSCKLEPHKQAASTRAWCTVMHAGDRAASAATAVAAPVGGASRRASSDIIPNADGAASSAAGVTPSTVVATSPSCRSNSRKLTSPYRNCQPTVRYRLNQAHCKANGLPNNAK